MGAITIHQCFSAFAAGLTVLAVGCTVGWTTVALKHLQSPTSVIPITHNQGSWIASCHELGHMISPIPAGYSLGKVGPKKCLIFSALLQTVGWIIIILTRSVMYLYLVRFLFGVSMGVIYTVIPLYIAEISNPKVRGSLSTIFQTMMYLGHLIEFIVGPYVSYNTLAFISVISPVAFLILSFWMAESPYYMIQKGRHVDAQKTFSSLSGVNDKKLVMNQLAAIEETIDKNKRASFKELFESNAYRSSLVIVLILTIVQRCSGMPAIIAYASFIFPSSIGGFSSSSYTILFGVITLLCTFIPAVLMDRVGRRILTIISCFGIFIVESMTSVYFYLAQNALIDTTHISWIPFTTMCLYAGFYSIGIGPIVTTIQGELFSPNIKGFAASIVAIVHAASSSLVTKSYQIISDRYGVYVIFSFFSLNCLFGSIFAYLIMPETKGKSLAEIQNG